MGLEMPSVLQISLMLRPRSWCKSLAVRTRGSSAGIGRRPPVRPRALAARRRILTQINHGEGRHRVIRAICYGRHGEIRKPYRQGQEDQLSAIGLVTNAVVLWNTIYMEAALNHLRAQGIEIRPADLTRLSPLTHRHIHLLGRYAFTLPEPIANGALRSLNQEELDDA